MKKIIFLDSESGLDKNIENKMSDIQDTLFIAMKPVVFSYLKRKGLPAQNTLPYFMNESHEMALEKSRILIDWLRDKTDFVNLDIGIQQAYKDVFIFWTRLAIHYCLWVIEIVSNAVDIHKPEIVSAVFSGKKSVSSLCIEPEEGYLNHIVKVIAQQRGLKYENISDITSDYDSSSVSQFTTYIPSLIRFILKYKLFQLKEKIISAKNRFAGRRPVFFTTIFYQMDKLAESIKLECPDREFYFLRGPVIPSSKVPDLIIKLLERKYSKAIISQKKILEDLAVSIKEETGLFSHRNISFADIISQKIKDNISDYILGLVLWSVKFNRFIDESNVSVFISNGNRADDVMLAELCQKKNIPDILISHGSHVRPKNEYENIEWGEHGRALLRAPFSHLALQSPLSEGYLEVFPTKNKTIKTGPLIWGKPVNFENSESLFKKMFDRKYDFGDIKVILHAGTPKASKNLRFYVYETPDEYVQAICNLANAVEKIPNAVLIVKFRPTNEISVNDLKTLVPFSEKVILSVDEPFLDVLGMADLLVSFSSTCIEEALQNRIPVLLYGGGGRYQHVSSSEIRAGSIIEASAAYHVKEVNDLEYGIKEILDLSINKKENWHLFEPYIYPQDGRIPLTDLLKL